MDTQDLYIEPCGCTTYMCMYIYVCMCVSAIWLYSPYIEYSTCTANTYTCCIWQHIYSNMYAYILLHPCILRCMSTYCYVYEYI